MKTENLSDMRLKALILDRINWDFRISKSDIKLVVKNGVAMVFGYFDRPYRKKALIDIVSSTQGVLAVSDQSQVLNDYHRTDSEIEKILLKKILEFPLSEGEWIDVDVSNGIVQFQGLVFHKRLKAFAAKMAWELSGVADCENKIKLGIMPGGSRFAIIDNTIEKRTLINNNLSAYKLAL